MNRNVRAKTSQPKNEIALKRGKIPKGRKNFESDVLANAAVASMNNPSLGASSTFERIQRALGGTGIDERGAMQVKLACGLAHTTGHTIEAAIRDKLGDEKDRAGRPQNVDVMFGDIPIEVKNKKKFDGLATDSQSLRRRDDKWYMYVKGDIKIGESCDYDIWLMRADALYDAVKAYKEIDDDSLEIPTIEEIESMIDDIKKSLATAIWSKATGAKPSGAGDDGDPVVAGKEDAETEAQKSRMSLKKKIGLNRVRFDLKFESLIRSYVRETLRG